MKNVYVVAEGMILSITVFENKADAVRYVEKYGPSGESLLPELKELPVYPTFASAPVPFGGTL